MEMPRATYKWRRGWWEIRTGEGYVVITFSGDRGSSGIYKLPDWKEHKDMMSRGQPLETHKRAGMMSKSYLRREKRGSQRTRRDRESSKWSKELKVKTEAIFWQENGYWYQKSALHRAEAKSAESKCKGWSGWAGRKWPLSVQGSRDRIIARMARGQFHDQSGITQLTSSLWIPKTTEKETGVSSMKNFLWKTKKNNQFST